MKRSFFKNLLWLQLLNWLVKPLWILWIEREMQLRMGDLWYGVYSIHFNFALLFAVLLDAGLNSYVSKEIAAHGKLIHVKRVVGLRIGLGFLYVMCAVGISHFQSGILAMFLMYAILNQLLAAGTLMLRAVLQGKQRFVADAWLSVVDRLVALAICSFILVNFSNSEFMSEGMILIFQMAQGAGYLAAILVGLVMVYWHPRRKFFNEKKCDLLVNSEVESFSETTNSAWLKSVIWFVVMALAMSVYTRIDVQMIQQLSPFGEGFDRNALGYREVGLYTKGYRLLDAALIFSALLSTQLLPIFSNGIAKQEDQTKVIWFGLRLVSWVGLGAALSAWYYGPEIMNLLYHGQMEIAPQIFVNGMAIPSEWKYNAEIYNAAEIFKVLMLAFIPMALVHVFGTYITAAGQIRWLALLALICVGINVGFNYIEIPKVGALAAATGCLITQWVFALACIIKTHKLGGFVWSSKRFETFFFLMVFGILAFVLVKLGIGLKGLDGLLLSVVAYGIMVGWTIFFPEIRLLKLKYFQKFGG